MRDGFLTKTKKIRVVAPTAHCTTLNGNARTLVNLGEKKWWASLLKTFKNKKNVNLFHLQNLIKKQKKNIRKVTYVMENLRLGLNDSIIISVRTK
jgi:hypothetical protein